MRVISRRSVAIGFWDVWISVVVLTKNRRKIKCALWSPHVMRTLGNRCLCAHVCILFVSRCTLQCLFFFLFFFARKKVASLSVQSWWSIIISGCVCKQSTKAEHILLSVFSSLIKNWSTMRLLVICYLILMLLHAACAIFLWLVNYQSSQLCKTKNLIFFFFRNNLVSLKVNDNSQSQLLCQI